MCSLLPSAFKWVKGWDPSQELLKPYLVRSFFPHTPAYPHHASGQLARILSNLTWIYLLSLQLHQPIFCFLFLE